MYAIFLCIILIILAFVYFVLIKPVTYWNKNGVLQHSPFQVWKNNALSLVRHEPVAESFQKFYNSFPNARYSGIYKFLHKSLIIRDVELIKKITVKDFDHFMNHKMFSPDEVLWQKSLFSLEGDKWKQMRSTLSPSFSSTKMKMMFNLVLDCTDQVVNYFEKQLETTSCVTVEMKDVSTRFANDVIASIAFGVTCDSLKDRNNRFYLMGQKILPQPGFWRNIELLIMFHLPILAQLCGFRYLSEKACNYFFNVIVRSLRNRKQRKTSRYDMVHLLIEARNNSKEGLSDLDITAQALLFFFGGFETVFTLISFMAYELAVNVDVQNRLQKEVDKTVKDCILYDDLLKMQYLDMVVSESLRKWPTASIIGRVCTKTYEIPAERPEEVSIRLIQGDLVWIPVYALHRDPNLFPNPERFDPERFTRENKYSLNTTAYIPFGSGPRSCIAIRFALIEIKLFFVRLLSKFDIVVVEKTAIPLKLANDTFDLTAEGGFWVGVKPRIKK